MERCDICGELIDWNNPNIHYGGHTCDVYRLDKVGATERYVGGLKQPYVRVCKNPEKSVLIYRCKACGRTERLERNCDPVRALLSGGTFIHKCDSVTFGLCELVGAEGVE